MHPSLALAIWFILLLALLRFDPAKDSEVSWALWVPVTWLFFLGSRPPAMWLGLSYGSAAQALEDGNPLDRTVFSLLIMAAIAILFSRSFRWGNFVVHNFALAFLLAFALLSVVWSDFPLATFKKWFRDAGLYIAVMVVLSDPCPFEAVRTVLRRVCYLLISLSIVLVKYYPGVGMRFSSWGGLELTGVSTSKNMLGVSCLVSGIFFFWDTLTRWHQRSEVHVRRVILVNIAFISMTLWLLNLSQSKTSTVCLVIGCLVIAAARRHSGWVRALAPASFLLYLILALGFDMGGQISEAVGRSSDMSDRIRIWQVLLSVPINPLLGTGYQSFFLGPRIQWVWARLTGDNVLQAHNGYLAIYLELGLIGLFLLSTFLITTYRKICKQLKALAPLGSLGLGLWTLLLFYNVTEAAFGGGLPWLALIMASVTVPQPAEEQVHALPPRALGMTEQATDVSLEMTGFGGQTD